MPSQRWELRVFVCLCVIFNLGCGLWSRSTYPNSLAPVRILTLTIDKSQREKFFDQLQAFADQHNFETQLTDFNTRGERFQFWMSRDDIFITASDVPPDPSLVYVSFYVYGGNSVDEETIDKLVGDLKSYINEIPNVTITEEK